jgi:hypothetical protein
MVAVIPGVCPAFLRPSKPKATQMKKLTLPDASTGLKLEESPITDKAGYAARWKFSKRHIDKLLAQGLPYFSVGKRRVRICIAEADAWMKEKFATRRRGVAHAK